MIAILTTLFIIGAFVLGLYIGTNWGVKSTLARLAKADRDGTFRIARKALEEMNRAQG